MLAAKTSQTSVHATRFKAVLRLVFVVLAGPIPPAAIHSKDASTRPGA